jgi:hypothetical protein
MRSTGRWTGRLARTARYAVALVLIAGGAIAQTAEVPADPPAEAPADQAAEVPIDQLDFSVLNETMPEVPLRTQPSRFGTTEAPAVGSRRENADGSVSVTAGHRLPTKWETKVGVDVAAPATLPDPLAGLTPQDRGAGWANLAVPAEPIGLDKATVDARVDPNADQGKLSTTLSRSVPVGAGLSLTLRNGYAVTQTLAAPNGGLPTSGVPTRIFTGDGGLRLDLPTATALSAGATMSSTDDRLLPSISAEQKLPGTPLSVTGAISGRPSGDNDRSIKAGFKHTW